MRGGVRGRAGQPATGGPARAGHLPPYRGSRRPLARRVNGRLAAGGGCGRRSPAFPPPSLPPSRHLTSPPAGPREEVAPSESFPASARTPGGSPAAALARRCSGPGDTQKGRWSNEVNRGLGGLYRSPLRQRRCGGRGPSGPRAAGDRGFAAASGSAYCAVHHARAAPPKSPIPLQALISTCCIHVIKKDMTSSNAITFITFTYFPGLMHCFTFHSSWIREKERQVRVYTAYL